MSEETAAANGLIASLAASEAHVKTLLIRIAQLEAINENQRAELVGAKATNAAYRAALLDVRKAVHFAQRTEDSAGKWAALCEDVMERIDFATSNAYPGKVILQALDAVLYFWENDPEAFGDDASVTSMAGKFAEVARKCQIARRGE